MVLSDEVTNKRCKEICLGIEERLRIPFLEMP